ncbi:MAG: hypothetical protein AB8U25_06285 [Rickettsiales endosymbiont of Dermacentor nuttalli]
MITQKKFIRNEWNDAINTIPKEEIRPVYTAVLKAFIENNAIKTMDPPKKSQYKKPFGTKIVMASDHEQDIALGMSDTATLRRYFSDFPNTNLDTKSLEVFANIYAGMFSSRINSKDAYQMSYSKKSSGLNVIGEERLARDTALSITQNFLDKVKTLSSQDLFILGQKIAPTNKITPMSLTLDQNTNIRKQESKSKIIQENFLKIVSSSEKENSKTDKPKEQNAKNKVIQDNVSSKQFSALKENPKSKPKQDKKFYKIVRNFLDLLMFKKSPEKGSSWYVEESNNAKYDAVISELNAKFKKDIKKIIAVDNESSIKKLGSKPKGKNLSR